MQDQHGEGHRDRSGTERAPQAVRPVSFLHHRHIAEVAQYLKALAGRGREQKRDVEPYRRRATQRDARLGPDVHVKECPFPR